MDITPFIPYQIDCKHCCGLCCVALWFSKTEGFPANKEAGAPCKNLLQDYKCKIHSALSQQGLKGCTAYDCFGAGQKITGRMNALPNWKTINASVSQRIFQSYLNVMQLHQTLWYLTEAYVVLHPNPMSAHIKPLLLEGGELAEQPLDLLQSLDITPFQEKSNKILKQVIQSLNSYKAPKDSMGRNMRQKNMAGWDFSMTYLIAANLEQANLRGANFLGADLRDTNIKNTDLSESLFLTQIQINGAKGNKHTKLPPYLTRPVSW